MKSLINSFLFIATIFFMVSCGEQICNYSPNEEGFGKLQDALKAKFGEDAYYEAIYIDYTPGNDDPHGLSMHLIATNEDPTKKAMGDWIYSSYTNWKLTDWVQVKVSKGEDVKNFLFQLSDRFDLKKVGKLIENSAKKLADEKNRPDAILKSANLISPSNDYASATQIDITMTWKGTKDCYKFFYDLDGHLLSWQDENEDVDDL